MFDTKVAAQRLVDMLGIEDRPALVVAAQCARVDTVGKVQLVGLSHHPIGPGLILLHDDVAADRPVVLAVSRVVEIGAAKIRADHHHQAVSDAVHLGVFPQVVDRTGQVGQLPFMVSVVVRVRVESAQPQLRAHRDAGLERQHRKLCLLAQRAAIIVRSLLFLLKLVFGRNRIAVCLQPPKFGSIPPI